MDGVTLRWKDKMSWSHGKGEDIVRCHAIE